MPYLITAEEYVEDFGYVETGDLLTKKEVINKDTDRTLTAMKAAMETGGKLNSDVVKTIELYIDKAEALVKLYTFKRYEFPPVNVEPILKDITKHIARSLFYDSFDRNTIPDNITAQYEKSLEILYKIKIGKLDLDIKPKDSTILYAI